MSAKATVVFTTHNRCKLLKKAILAAQHQSIPVDIIVMDDASTDSTQTMIATEFPDVSYHRSLENKGPCYHRNRGIELAQTDIVFPIDDDSVLQSSFTLEQTLKEFDDPRVGAVAIPFINVLQDQIIWTKAPDLNQIYITHAFVAASHAIRRDTFLAVGGYRENFFYMGEEGDVSIRLLQYGLYVRLGSADPIHHYQSPNRVSPRADTYGRRNDVLFIHYNAPSQMVLPYLVGTTLKGFWFGLKVMRPYYMLKGLYQGYREILSWPQPRQPIEAESYQLFRLLKKKTAIPLSELEMYFKNRSNLSVSSLI